MPALRLRPDLEEALSRIQGVTAASVTTLADGQPTEIHVLASPDRHAKQIVRDVQSLAMAQFGLDLDHRIVSVVQLDPVVVAAAVAPAPSSAPLEAPAPELAPEPAPEPAFASTPVTAAAPEPQFASAVAGADAWNPVDEAQEIIDLRDHEPVALSVVGSERPHAAPAAAGFGSSERNGNGRHAAAARVMLLPDALAAEAATDDDPAPRPAIASIMVRTSNGESEATVAVGAGGHMFEGQVVGPAGATHRPRLVAQATLAAVSDLLGQAAEIESAHLVAAGSRLVAVTVLTVQTPRIGEQVMSGSAVVRGDEADAVARSVLDALNRRISG
jgi:hypothetical protein